MRLFKIILILVLLISVSFSVCGDYGQPLTQGEISDWRTIGEVETIWIVLEEPDTLIEWFADLSLEEKVELYNWWKNGSVTIVSEDDELKIEDDDRFYIPMPSPIPAYPRDDWEDYIEDIGEEPGFWFAKPEGEDDD